MVSFSPLSLSDYMDLFRVTVAGITQELSSVCPAPSTVLAFSSPLIVEGHLRIIFMFVNLTNCTLQIELEW